MSTLSEVAKLAGVSVSTVSKVLNGAPGTRVGADTRERIQQAARDLQYRPNFAARSLKLSRAQTIALFVPDLTNAVFAPLVYGAEEEARVHGFTLFLGRTEDLASNSEQLTAMAREGRIDGAIVQLLDTTTEEQLRELQDSPVPYIFMNTVAVPDRPYVGLDDEGGSSVATQHVIDLGHREIAFIGGRAGTRAADDRLAGYRATMRANGLATSGRRETAFGNTVEQGVAAIGALLDSKEPMTAVVVANVNAALGVIREARERGLRVPQDLSVVSVHDAMTAEHSWPALTTVRMPLGALGRQAVRSLLEAIGVTLRPEMAVTESVEPQLVLRQSTAAH